MTFPHPFDKTGMKLIEVYLFYDEPLIFSCENEQGEKFLAIAKEEKGHSYCRVSDEELKSFDAISEGKDDDLFTDFIANLLARENN